MNSTVLAPRGRLCRVRAAVLATLSGLLATLAASSFAQGTLTPPAGAPAPSMRTLAQVEPRIPLAAGSPGVTANANGGYSIGAPGSYYLTGPVAVATGNAITITAGAVTLDLAGFDLKSTAAPGTLIGAGIYVLPGESRVTLRHGSISGQVSIDTSTTPDTYADCGFTHAILASGNDLVTVENIHAYACRHGIILAESRPTLVRDCIATRHSVNGITAAVVRSCLATDIGGIAIRAAEAIDCQGESQGSAGIWATTALHCRGTSVTGHGIYGTAASDCDGVSVSGSGLFIDIGSNCRGQSTSGSGLLGLTLVNCTGVTVSGTSGLSAQNTTGCHGTNSSGIQGLYALNALNCHGVNATGAVGLFATNATNCSGSNHSGQTGLDALMATACHGSNYSGDYGLYVRGTAAYCYGSAYDARATALYARLGIGCRADGTMNVVYPYLMP